MRLPSIRRRLFLPQHANLFHADDCRQILRLLPLPRVSSDVCTRLEYCSIIVAMLGLLVQIWTPPFAKSLMSVIRACAFASLFFIGFATHGNSLTSIAISASFFRGAWQQRSKRTQLPPREERRYPPRCPAQILRAHSHYQS